MMESQVSSTFLQSGLSNAVLKKISGESAFLETLGREAAHVSVSENARAYFVASMSKLSSRNPILVVTSTAVEAEHYAADLQIWLGKNQVEIFPAWETLPFERLSPGIETMGRRLEVLSRLRSDNKPDVVVAPLRAILQRLATTSNDFSTLTVNLGAEFEREAFIQRLIDYGYHREFQVEHRGEMAVRGGIVDVFPSTADVPIRIDFWGDEIERLAEFDVGDQRSIADLNQVKILPARELRPDAEMREKAVNLKAIAPWGTEHWEKIVNGELFDGLESWLPWLVDINQVLPDLLDSTGHVVLVEPSRLRSKAIDLKDEERDLARSLAGTWGALTEEGEPVAFPSLYVSYDRLLEKSEAAVLTLDNNPKVDGGHQIEVQQWETLAGDSLRLLNQIKTVLSSDGTLVVAADSESSAERLRHTLSDEGIELSLHVNSFSYKGRGGGHIVVAPLEFGFVAPKFGVAVLTEREFTGRRRTHRVPKTRRGAQTAFDDLSPGDFVVHYHHGVSKYQGIVNRKLMGAERDYLVLDFKGSDKLYLPTDQIDLIRPYIGGESPSLSRMGGTEFQKQKARVRAAVNEIAQELVVLYQKRTAVEGHSFPIDTPWMREISDSFPFRETPDQTAAINDVLKDMGSAFPMDRLVCGDVGFGKTEVAIRAAFCAVNDGLQAAILVPTTLLAQQHHQTFVERYREHGVRVEVLSRFLTPAQQRGVVRDIEDGSVDVVIGTHRLLSGDVRFKNLGILVVDEEQRFGVTHKESIKQFKANVDVLTLTATPIPRTLEMSLTGIRDLSLLQTAPAERQPILTHVGEYDERAVAEAMRRELLRDGQVFFVHNRVADIEQVAHDLNQLVPEARIAVAHGQMDEGSLEQVVIDFWEQRYDVLVCTTIIESGIDMPSVNTLVVDRADLLGLGQLHQIRGRVGRSGQRAYAYLFHPVNRSLSDQAYERLKTIGESTALGSGFRIAMRDLELRGAGNLLSGVQSGHIAAVGYDLYCEMVTEAVADLKGETPDVPSEISLDLPLQAFLPDVYVERQEQRLEAYRRLASVTEMSQVIDIEAEWTDRYGPVPEAAKILLHIGLLRTECVRLSISEISVSHGTKVRLLGIILKESEQLRLRRLATVSPLLSGLYKEDSKEIVLSFRTVDSSLPGRLFSFLQELRPTVAE
jgi:transcription-repair coupling factor (superfamily II helicase)